MTPKEKAKELVDKYINPFNRNGFIPSTEVICYSTAKQCVLIAVDEILNVIAYNKWESEHQMTRGQYWQEVKQEINNL